MKSRWKTLTRTFVHRSQNPEDEVSVRKDRVQPPKGEPFDYVFVDCPYEVVFCMGCDAQGRVLLIKQYRFLFDEWLWEIPAGSPSPGESLEEAARREFEEESGFIASKVEHYCEFYPSVGITNQRCHLFLATGIQAGSQDLDDAEEVAEIRFVDSEELRDMLRRGEIRNAGTVIGAMAALIGAFGQRTDHDR